VTRYSRHVLPSGMVVSLAVPEFRAAYGMPVSLAKFIPIRSPEEIAAEERREAAGKALAVLRAAVRKPRPGRARRLEAQPCASCVLGAPLRLLPLAFPLAPLSAS